ncbi:hypothetical protein, partial [Ochrobactrum sp. S1502_03]|uniref:hypothetical protein n=1 Tax=Ochrobactrum sp. S1502_03 TaxID=3108451 RepID=UPI0037CB0A68
MTWISMSLIKNITSAAHKNLATPVIRFTAWGILASFIFVCVSFRNSYLTTPLEIKSILFTLAIGFFLYSMLSIALHPLVSTIIISSIIIIIHIASNEKMTVTGEPLIFGDISARGQRLTAESIFDSKLPFGGYFGRTDRFDRR